MLDYKTGVDLDSWVSLMADTIALIITQPQRFLTPVKKVNISSNNFTVLVK